MQPGGAPARSWAGFSQFALSVAPFATPIRPRYRLDSRSVFAENLANKLIGLLVTVGVLAAVYFFAIKPVLDTTNEAFDRAFDATDGITEEIQQSFDDSGLKGFNADSIDIDDTSTKQAERLLNCVQRAQPDTDKMQRCVQRFG